MAGEAVAAEIADALLTFLAAEDISSPALPIADPNVQFDPHGHAYLEATFFPNRPTGLWLASASPNHHQGLFQVTVVWPSDNDGIIPPLIVAGLVVERFARGTKIDHEGIRVSIDATPWAAQPLQEKKWIRVPVTIPYRMVSVN